MATNIINTFYPHSDKYQNIHKNDNLGGRFFGSETFGAKFNETFSETYQQTEGVNFSNYEASRLDGYQDISGETVRRIDKKKKRGKKKN